MNKLFNNPKYQALQDNFYLYINTLQKNAVIDFFGEEMQIPKYGLLSILARITPTYLYDHPKVINWVNENKKIQEQSENYGFTDGYHLFIDADKFYQLEVEEQLVCLGSGILQSYLKSSIPEEISSEIKDIIAGNKYNLSHQSGQKGFSFLNMEIAKISNLFLAGQFKAYEALKGENLSITPYNQNQKYIRIINYQNNKVANKLNELDQYIFNFAKKQLNALHPYELEEQIKKQKEETLMFCNKLLKFDFQNIGPVQISYSFSDTIKVQNISELYGNKIINQIDKTPDNFFQYVAQYYLIGYHLNYSKEQFGSFTEKLLQKYPIYEESGQKDFPFKIKTKIIDNIKLICNSESWHERIINIISKNIIFEKEISFNDLSFAHNDEIQPLIANEQYEEIVHFLKLNPSCLNKLTVNGLSILDELFEKLLQINADIPVEFFNEIIQNETEVNLSGTIDDFDKFPINIQKYVIHKLKNNEVLYFKETDENYIHHNLHDLNPKDDFYKDPLSKDFETLYLKHKKRFKKKQIVEFASKALKNNNEHLFKIFIDDMPNFSRNINPYKWKLKSDGSPESKNKVLLGLIKIKKVLPLKRMETLIRLEGKEILAYLLKIYPTVTTEQLQTIDPNTIQDPEYKKVVVAIQEKSWLQANNAIQNNIAKKMKL